MHANTNTHKGFPCVRTHHNSQAAVPWGGLRHRLVGPLPKRLKLRAATPRAAPSTNPPPVRGSGHSPPQNALLGANDEAAATWDDRPHIARPRPSGAHKKGPSCSQAQPSRLASAQRTPKRSARRDGALRRPAQQRRAPGRSPAGPLQGAQRPPPPAAPLGRPRCRVRHLMASPLQGAIASLSCGSS